MIEASASTAHVVTVNNREEVLQLAALTEALVREERWRERQSELRQHRRFARRNRRQKQEDE